MGNVIWTKEEQREMLELLSRGYTPDAVGKHLDRNESAVLTRLSAVSRARETGKDLFPKQAFAKWTSSEVSLHLHIFVCT